MVKGHWVPRCPVEVGCSVRAAVGQPPGSVGGGHLSSLAWRGAKVGDVRAGSVPFHHTPLAGVTGLPCWDATRLTSISPALKPQWYLLCPAAPRQATVVQTVVSPGPRPLLQQGLLVGPWGRRDVCTLLPPEHIPSFSLFLRDCKQFVPHPTLHKTPPCSAQGRGQ